MWEHLFTTMSVQSWLGAGQKDGKRIGFLIITSDKTMRDVLSRLKCAILSIPPEYGFTLPGMMELLRQWNIYNQTTLKEHYDKMQLHTLERRTSSPKTKGRWSGPKIKPRPFSGNRFRPHHLSSDLWKRRLEHFRPDGTARRLSRQSTIDPGSQAKRLFVSFSRCRPTETQHPFHFKRRDPFSRHQRSHHLFWKVLSFPLLLLKVLIYYYLPLSLRWKQ